MNYDEKCRVCEGVGETREYVCNPVFGGIELLYATEECSACGGTGIEIDPYQRAGDTLLPATSTKGD